MPSDSFHYDGFSSPNYTPCPDDLFDVIAPNLTEAELRVLLYIIRRTFGFQKTSDAISVSQMERGITTRDGQVLDLGTGMSRTAIRNGCRGLIAKGLLTVRKTRSPDGEYETNVYSLRFADSGVGHLVTHPRSLGDPRVGQQVTPQETVRQETVRQDFEASNGRIPFSADDDRLRETLLPFADDFGREFVDQAPLAATLSRLVNLYQRSGRDLNDYIELLYRARRITKERSAAIRGTAETVRGKAKMGYFFAILEDQLGDCPAAEPGGGRPA